MENASNNSNLYLDTFEQKIIQHIRTAGIINKSKETSIVDELLDFRRERRKVFSALMRDITNQNEMLQKLSKDLHDREIDSESKRKEIESVKLSHEKMLMDLKSKSAEELRNLQENSLQREKSALTEMRRKYDLKVKLIESKIDEVFHEKFHTDKKDATSMATILVKKVITEMETKYSSSLSE